MTTRTAITNLVPLSDEVATHPELVGAKAANLALAMRAGFPVPRGVVIPAGHPDPSTVVDEVVKQLDGGPFAVRSSATAEDLPDSSYAGQYESFLDVKDREELVAAIEECRASLNTERVSVYAANEDPQAMAVLIQPMVEAVAAGVAFSANPVTGARHETVVNAVEGLGDRLVSGEVTPMQWVVSGDDIQGSEGLLLSADVREIADLARAVEAHFGTPQDIEWAMDASRLWLLQARPITSLPPPPVEPIPIEFEVPEGFWQHDASHAPVPNYPIESFIPEMVASAVKMWATEFGYLFDGIEFRDIGGWLYQRLAPLGGKEGPELPQWLMWVMVRIVPSIRTRLAKAREAVLADKPGECIDRWYEEWLPELAQGAEQLKAVELTELTDYGLVAHLDACLELGTRGIEIHAVLHGSLAIMLYELVTTCDRLLGMDMATTLEMVRGTSHKSTEPARELAKLADLARAEPEVLKAARMPDAKVLEWMGENHPGFAEALRRYLDEYGQVALGQTVVEPTYAEMPSVLMASIAHQVDTGFAPDDSDEANKVRRDAAIAEARARLGSDPEALDEFNHVLERALRAYPVREDNEFFTFSRPFAQFRYAVLELGDRLASRDVIAQRDDVMFLHLGEAKAALAANTDLRSEVDLRKGQRSWAEANPGPPFYGEETPPPTDLSFLPSDTRLPMEAMLWSLDSIMAVEASKKTQSEGSEIIGMPASAGTYTGPVRVVRNESEFAKIEAGDVLVCPITSPVWSVLFPSIGALVTDTGGILSHPAIIAREYAIPAVVATGNATALLQDGQVVTVDGATGSVSLI